MTTSTIKPSGGDYTSLSAWESAKQGDFVTETRNEIAECYTFSGGLTDNINIDGSTTNATYHHTITVAAGNRHGGIPKSAFYIKAGTADSVGIRCNDDYSEFDWVDIDGVTNGKYCLYIPSGSGGAFTNCIGGAGTASGVSAFWQATGSATPVLSFINCLAYAGNNGFKITWATLTNCVAANCTNGFLLNAGGSSTRYGVNNCVAYNNTTNWTIQGIDLGSSNNATSSASDDAPGANSVINIASGDFSNAAGNNFHLSGTGSALYHMGVTTSGVVYDVDGDEYDTSTPSIGFDEVVSGAQTYTQTAGADGAVQRAVSATSGADAATQCGLSADAALDADVELRQWLRPIADVSAGAWAPSAGADLYATLDEAIPSDADWDATGSVSTMEVRLTAATDPASSANHQVRYRAKGDGATDLVVSLKQGAATIASWTETNVPASETTFEHTLSGAQADAITDYSDLRLSIGAA